MCQAVLSTIFKRKVAKAFPESPTFLRNKKVFPNYWETGLDIFQPSNQNRTDSEALSEAEMRYYYFSFFLDFYYYVYIATTFMSK